MSKYAKVFSTNRGIDCFVNSHNNDVIIVRFNNIEVPVILERNGGDLIVNTTPEGAACKTELLILLEEMLPLISDIDYKPFFSAKTIVVREEESQATAVAQKNIMSDRHVFMLNNKIKPLCLSKKDVEKRFSNLKDYDLAMYCFSELIVDNSVRKPEPIKVDKDMYTDAESVALLEKVKAKVADTTLTEQTKDIIANISAGIEKNILLIGSPGSGKSIAAQQVSAELGIPLVSVNGHADAGAEMIYGGYRPVTVTDTQEIKDAGAPLVRYDGSFVEAYSKGYIYSFEEPNYVQPSILGRLNNALDFVGELVLEDGTRIKRHPNFIFIASVNAHLVGTHPMNPALIDRMHGTYYYDTPDANDYIKWAKSRLEYTNDGFINALHNFMTNNFKSLLVANGSVLYPSFRGVEILLAKLDNGIEFSRAMTETFVNPLYLDLSEDAIASIKTACKPLFKELQQTYKLDHSSSDFADINLTKDFIAGDDLNDVNLEDLASL